jgi:hypothetical protein
MDSMRVLRYRIVVEGTRHSTRCAQKPPINWQEGTRKSQLLLLERDSFTVKDGSLLEVPSTSLEF